MAGIATEKHIFFLAYWNHYKMQLNCLPSFLFPLMHAYWFRKWVADWFGTEWPHVYWAHKSTGLLVLGLLTGGQATVIRHTPLLSLLAAEWFWSWSKENATPSMMLERVVSVAGTILGHCNNSSNIFWRRVQFKAYVIILTKSD